MKEKLTSINLPAALLLILTIRLGVMEDISIGSALALVAISGVYAYRQYLTIFRNAWNKDIEKEISDIKNGITSLKVGETLRKTNEQYKGKRLF